MEEVKGLRKRWKDAAYRILNCLDSISRYTFSLLCCIKLIEGF